MKASIDEHRLVVQEGVEVRLPWPYSYPPGYRITVEHKKSGKVLRAEAYINCAELTADGETLMSWRSVE